MPHLRAIPGGKTGLSPTGAAVQTIETLRHGRGFNPLVDLVGGRCTADAHLVRDAIERIHEIDEMALEELAIQAVLADLLETYGGVATPLAEAPR